jgi:TRAP-type mannitol/chloroaromatic compound transport system permease large subunit
MGFSVPPTAAAAATAEPENMMFGSISGSAVAAAAAVGGTLNPIQRQKGYDPTLASTLTCPSDPGTRPTITCARLIKRIAIPPLFIRGLDNFALLAIPFFIFAGTLMNSGGIAIRLINLAQASRLPPRRPRRLNRKSSRTSYWPAR